VARGKIEVSGGLLELMAPQDGTVDTVLVAEGDAVRRGQVLLRLGAEAARLDAAMADAELRAAETRQQAQQQRIAPARQLVQRLQEAAAAGAVDAQRSDEAQQARSEAEAAAAIAAADVRVARQRVVQARHQLERLTLKAPQDGTVLRLQTQPGARAALGGRPLMVVLPRRPLLVRAELNESFLAVVKPGQRATVTPDAGNAPSSGFAGRVQRISPVYGPSRLDEDNPARAGLRVVDCWIEFDQAPPLRVGQDVRVNFHD
jgi:multidrug resistance efflux pump